MSELVPFSRIDYYEQEDDPDYHGWTDAQKEAAEFLSKMDWEGGIAELLYYSTDAFPEELRDLANRTYAALEALRIAVNEWAAERGVEY